MLYPSKTLAWSSGKTLTWAPWVNGLSKRRNRNIIHGFFIHAAYQVDTTAAGVLAGEDLAKFFTQIHVEDSEGVRRLLTGEALRIMNYGMLGPQGIHEMADIAISQTDLTGDAFCYIPFEQPRARGNYDTCLPADLLKQIKLVCPTQDTLDLVAATTVDSVDYTVYADVREDDNPDEDGVRFYVRDRIETTVMESTTQGTIDMAGQKLAECFAYSPGADGGASMANWTAHQLIGLEEEPISSKVRLLQYRFHNKAGDNLQSTQSGEVRLDPVTAGRAIPVHFPRPDYKAADLPKIQRNLKVSATNSVAAPTIVHRTLEPESVAQANRVAEAYGVSTYYMATKGKTSREIAGWKDDGRFMPKKGRRRGQR